MSVIFCGDLVLPYHTDVDYSAILPLFKNHRTIVNFEGSILKDEKETTLYRWNDKFSLYSCPKVLNVLKDLNVEVVSLCNNHILDYQHDINETIDILKKYNIESWGLKNHDVWKSKLNGKPLFVITFATFSNEHSLPLFSPLKVIEEIKDIRQQNKDSYIVVFPHWGIEKFYYPEPADRSLAHRMIDAGVDLIVGHHPHVIQPIEIYKGKHIFYSLGNFILPQTFYADKKLVYRQQEVKNEFIVKWDGMNVNIYSLYFDVENNVLRPNLDYDIQKDYSLFATEYDWWTYCRVFCSKSSLLNIAFRTRFFTNDFGERINWIQRNLFRIIRKVMIRMGIHNPY